MCVICRHLLNNYKVHDTCIQILCIGPWLVNIDLVHVLNLCRMHYMYLGNAA